MEQTKKARTLTSLEQVQPTEVPPLNQALAELLDGAEGARILGHVRLYLQKYGVAAGDRAREMALEVVNEMVVEVLAHAERFDHTRNLRAWLLGIAHNLVLRRRKQLNQQRVREPYAAELAVARELTEEQLLERLTALHVTGPEDPVLESIGINAVLACLRPEQRQIVELFLFHDLSAPEVGAALGISPGAARVRLHRVLPQLRAVWARLEADQQENHRHA